MRLNIEQRDNGQPELVMIHGLTRRWQTFTPLLPSLQARYSLTLLDLPGHGESEANRAGYQVRHYAEAVLAWLDQNWNAPSSGSLTTNGKNGEKCFHLYGHSLGAMVALHVAADRPECVQSLILEDPPFHTMGARIGETVWMSHFRQVHLLRNAIEFISASRSRQVEMLADIILFNPKTGDSVRLGSQRDASSLRFMAACMSKMDADVIAPVVEGCWLAEWDWEQLAARVHQPTLILRADEKAGGMLTEQDCQQLCSLLADPVPVFFSNSGHNLHWLRPQDVCNSVHTFLDS